MSQISRFTISMGAFAVIVLALFVPVQAQTLASCNFNFFPMFPSSPTNSQFVPMGGNDFGTVVGRVYFSHTTPQLAIQAFIRYSGGGITYYTYPNSVYNQFNQFTARNNNGATLLMVEPAGEYDYIVQGSSMTKIVVPNSQWRSTHATAINKYNSVVGTYGHLDGYQGGFKPHAWALQRRRSNGFERSYTLDGVAGETEPQAIGKIVAKMVG